MLLLAGAAGPCVQAVAQQAAPMAVLQGRIQDGKGQPSLHATVSVAGVKAHTDASGRYTLQVPLGDDTVEVRTGTMTAFRVVVHVEGDRSFDIDLRDAQVIAVNASADPLSPDPATQGYSRDELLQANPGRPGVPVSIPGYPAETASGGIKAPQYFAPGVAGDHGEPIAQFVGIGSFLLPNNLTANAHGNGYADPNILVSDAVAGVVVDGGAFNARYGDHAVNLAVTYELRPENVSSVQINTNGKDVAMGGTWARGRTGWLAGEALLGNGWLERPEERQQYKLNGLREWVAGSHQITAFGLGYYGFSRLPGLIPLDVRVPGETVDGRQTDLTHTSIAAVVDEWQTGKQGSLTTGAYFRTYSLDLRSNFGDGLIRQSEFRTVVGGTSTWVGRLGPQWTLVGGLEARRDAPRGLDLQHLDEATERFLPVSSNDLTIETTAPFAAVTGTPVKGVHLYAGARHDQLCFRNHDLLATGNSFDSCPGFTSPKVNVAFGSAKDRFVPQVAFSFAEAFHANDPRIGIGSTHGQLLSTSREYQVVATKAIAGAELHLTLGQVASSSAFAQLDADTGLQEDVGPSLNRFLTVQLNQRRSSGFWQVSWSEADARDRDDGTPIPEAPRTLVDALAGSNRLPWGLAGKTEFEYVKAKPLGDGVRGVPLREWRFSLSRAYRDGRVTASAEGLWVQGFSGQTLETIGVGDAVASERAVGVPAASYATVGVRYNFVR